MTGAMSAQGSIAQMLEEDRARGMPINAQKRSEDCMECRAVE